MGLALGARDRLKSHRGCWSIWLSMGAMTMDFSLAEQAAAQLPHPVQSWGSTWIRYRRPWKALPPLASLVT